MSNTKNKFFASFKTKSFEDTRGIGREISFVYFFIMAVVITIGFVSAVMIYKNSNIDAKEASAESLALKIQGCIYENKEEFAKNIAGFDVFSKCSIKKEYLEKQKYYIGILFKEGNTGKPEDWKEKIIFGDKSYKAKCELKKQEENLPGCGILVFSISNINYPIKLITGIQEKNA